MKCENNQLNWVIVEKVMYQTNNKG